MNRITCTCQPDEPECPYCRCERLRLERLYRDVESFAAAKATVGVKLKAVGYRRGPYRTQKMQNGRLKEAA